MVENEKKSGGYKRLVSGIDLAAAYQRGRAVVVPQASGETAPSEVVTVEGSGFGDAYDQVGLLSEDLAYEVS
ncbi:MAG: hypothetical protein H6860_01700 [Rhodospirillales bacterium]|nr:hypothetical protein [Alphaproteobacteria bacterium]MCB9981094.1 hypothetical protein [Rhodospirillales bacterium]